MGGPALDHGGVGQVAFEVEEALWVRFIRSTSEARALHAADTGRIVGLGAAEHLPYAVCRELLRDRVQGAPPQAATSAIRILCRFRFENFWMESTLTAGHA